jgi:hypothetical protein
MAKRKANEAALDAQRNMNENPPKTAEANYALAQQKSFEAEARLYENQINRANVKSDIDGVILEGIDVREKKNAPVKLGEQLMVIGQREKLKGELRVAERDIQDVYDPNIADANGNKKPSSGKLATTALPNEKFPFIVDRVVPRTEPKEGDNYFQVFVTLDQDSADWPKDEQGKKVDPRNRWMSGMEGEARIDVSKKPIAWVWTHRLIDFVRLKLWI